MPKKQLNKNSLLVKYPELAQEWHPILNGEILPAQVAGKSRLRVWWKCNKGHEWQARIYSRAIGTGCPYCSNKKVDGTNCFATLYPNLLKQWHPTLNTVSPYNISRGYSKKVIWQCDKKENHIWSATLKSRLYMNTGCPYCANRKTDLHNCLATTHPEVAKEWHLTKNGKLTPKDVTSGSGLMAYWQCKDGHAWKCRIQARLQPKKGKSECSECKKLSNKYPLIAKEWCVERNGTLTPNDIAAKSLKIVWWKCNNNPAHVWKCRISSRTTQNIGCPYCSNRKVNKASCLATINPRLARE